MNLPQTLPEALEQRGSKDEPFLTSVIDSNEEYRTTGQLYSRALGVAARLNELGLSAGDRLLLLVPNGRVFVETLFGALAAGVVPVIFPPPHTARVLPRYLAQLRRIVEQCRPWGIVLDPEALDNAASLPQPGLRLIAPPEPSEEPLAKPRRVRAEDTAVVQYSSGSTGDPKGVVLSHRAILENAGATHLATGWGPSDVVLSWLPFCHDMGLFGGVIFPWCLGSRTVNMLPQEFLIDPASWLQGMARYRATITLAPNFAYALCAHTVADKELAGVDLSLLRLAFNGGEPVTRGAMEGFATRFGHWGLSPTALFPVYGMAENTAAVAFPPLQRGPRFDRIRRKALEREGKAIPAPEPTGTTRPRPDPEIMEAASLGQAIPGTRLRILDEKGEPVPERVEGDIWVQGSSLTSGYLENSQATAEAIHGNWLNTGDRGYFAGGEIYVTGRQSDLIIKAGRNVHPQDLEAAAGEVSGARRGCVAALGVRDAADSTEEVLLLVETRLRESDELKTLIHRLRAAVLEVCGIAPDRIVLIEPRALPKTSSGKLQRRLARRLLQSGELAILKDV